MPDMYDAGEREALMRRLSALQQTSVREWGKMNAAQMLAHCSAALEVACGDPIRKQMFIGRVLGPFAKAKLLGDKPFSRNSPTDPTFKIVDDRDFSAERRRLTELVERFASRGPSGADGLVHSFFGRLSAHEWSRLMYKHIDHHLRQFGA